jgi:hypothetical protein
MPKMPKIPKNPKRASKPQTPESDDDSSVDSHGNIRGLIAYSEESSRSSDDRRKKLKGKGKTKKPLKTPSPKPKLKTKFKVKPKKPVESESDSEEEEEETVVEMVKRKPRKAAVKAAKRIERIEAERRRLKKKQLVSSSDDDDEDDEDLTLSDSEEEEELSDEEDGDAGDGGDDDDEDEDEDEDEEEDEEDEDDDEDEEDGKGRRGRSALGGIELLISDLTGGGDSGPPKPKKYKLSKEPENVRRFVKLIQTEVEENADDIDRDIGYFKGLTPKSQDRLLEKLRHKVEPVEPAVPLKFQILTKEVAPEVERVAMSKYMALQNIDPSSTEYYKTSQWIHGYTQLPIGIYKDLPVKLEDGAEPCQAFVSNVRKAMDDAIYGHDEAKLQILQFVSNWIANPKGAGNVLSIHGPPGVGKTTLVKDGVAKALGRPFHFITLGGATDASYLDGHSYTYEGSTWGRIVDVLIKSKCMNPVIYFDELDKVSETPKGEEINNLLIHLTDGSQNDRFQDKYFTGIDLDLSRCLFIFSHNAHEKVNPILRDRMYNIQVEGFGLKEKLVIADQYLVSQALRDVGLFEKVGFGREIVTHIIQEHTGEERGVRELKRCIQTVVSKINLLRFYNDPKRVPFAIEGFALPFTLKKEHIDLFLKKKSPIDESIRHMYC